MRVVHSDPEAIAAFIKSHATHVAGSDSNGGNVDMAVDRVE